MSSSDKQLCSPFASGGGGVNFECQVQAAFTVLMLTGGIVPCLERCWPIKEIQLQARRKGAQIDDFIVVTQDAGSNRTAKLFAQVKHVVTVSDAKTNKVFAEVIQAAWKDYNNPELFAKGQDAIVMITRQLSGADISGTQEMLEWAKTTASAKEFFTNVLMTKFGNSSKKSKLAAFRNQLMIANGGVAVSENDTHDFLRHFHLIGFDLDMRASVNAALLHSHISQYSVPTIEGIWAQIFLEASRFNKNGGTITWENLPESITECFGVIKKTTRSPEGNQEVCIPQLTPEKSEAMALAVLLGGWNESLTGDMEIVAQLVGQNDS